jgi:DNA polymerase-3 subunit gamma/tau
VIEIDGASHRGIEEIRAINETVGYATATGFYKVYIIDEVHMLTKEAFNALLKTLEEPPPHVKFFFATTEPHKVLPTILSRCQHLHLRRLSSDTIVHKLELITQDLQREVEKEVLYMVAQRAEGGFRNAESLLDQLLSFYEGAITVERAAHALGTLPREVFFRLDQAGKEGNLSIAFDVAFEIFHEGKDLAYFVQMLTEHYRHLLICKLGGVESQALEIPQNERPRLHKTAQIYLKEQLLFILEKCQEAESDIRFATSPRIALEGLLLKILRSHSQIPIDHLVNRLMELEKRLADAPVVPEPSYAPTHFVQAAPSIPTQEPMKEAAPARSVQAPQAPMAAVAPSMPAPEPIKEALPSLSAPSPRYDTIMQFAAVEFEGKIIRK